MKIINLFGAPGAGKSTAMLGLTYQMKMLGFSVENTPEFFKEMVYENSKSETFGGQLYVLGEQNRRLARLKGKNEYIVTDCPLPLISFYTSQKYIKGFQDFSRNLFNSYENINYLLYRKHQYETEKRIHTEKDSCQIEKDLPEFLKKEHIELTEMATSPDLVNCILQDLIEKEIIILPNSSKKINLK